MMIKRLVVIFSISVLCFLSFFFGRYIGDRGVGIALNHTQLMISFHHLQEYKKIKHAIESGCTDLAQTRLDYRIDTEKMLMAGFLQDAANESAVDYIELRDEKLISELKEHEADRNKTWDFPDCDENRAALSP